MSSVIQSIIPAKCSSIEPCIGRKAIPVHITQPQNPDGLGLPFSFQFQFLDNVGSIQGLWINPFDNGAAAEFNITIEATGQIISIQGYEGYIPLLGFDSSTITITPMSSGILGITLYFLNWTPQPYLWNTIGSE